MAPGQPGTGQIGTVPIVSAIAVSRGAVDHIAAAPEGSQDTEDGNLQPTSIAEAQELSTNWLFS